MIVPKHRSWLRDLGHWRGSAFRVVWLRVVVVTAAAAAVTYLHHHDHWFQDGLTVAPFTIVGLVLGIFLGFRNNTSYDRFWEARKLWGSLVNTARTLTRQVLTLIGTSDASEGAQAQVKALQRECIHGIIAYAHALRHRLRDEKTYADVEKHLAPELFASVCKETNPPIGVLAFLSQRFRAAYDAGWLHPQHLPLLEGSLTCFTDIQGGCERIQATPIPFSYNVLLHRTVAMYCFALPFGLVHTVGLFTPLVVAFVCFAFFAVDAVGEEIEEPFGLDPNDLPLHAISVAIERDALCRLGEPLPPPVGPVNEMLS